MTGLLTAPQISFSDPNASSRCLDGRMVTQSILD